MCGICGFYEFDNTLSEQAVNENLAAMCQIMKHRGPDDTGTYISNAGMHLGAVRLSIIDLSGGHQPISNEDGSCWVALNGEIYNYPALRQRLLSLGHTLKTKCDTEAIVHAYEEWGDDCPQYLEGMFAFAIVDKKRQRMLIARDRFGKKPLYYTLTPGAFVFGSEIKTVMAYPEFAPQLNRDAIDLFLTLGYIPGPHSIHKNVEKLLPGHTLVIDQQRKVETRSYWDIPNTSPNARPHDIHEAAEHVTELLEKSVEARLLSDVPLGVFLSGGLDSSLITALTRKFKKDKLKSFSVRFTGTEHDESSYAKIVADHLGTEHYELDANHCEPDVLRKLIWHCDEPLADPAIVPTYLVSKLAKEQVTVALTGEGADEFFGGYFYHALERNAVGMDWMPRWAKQNLLTQGAKLINQVTGRQRYHHRTIWSWQLEPAERVLAWMAFFTDEEKQRWFSPAMQTLGQNQLAANHFRQLADHYGPYDRAHWLERFTYIDAKMPLVDDLLMKVDKMSMAASLEARCPFLDHHLVEYAFHMPEALKFNPADNKLVLREVAKKVLPKEISGRRKHGFDVPLRQWLEEDLQSLFWDLTTSKNFVEQDIIAPAQIQEIWQDMINDVDGTPRQLWNILVLATWFDVAAA